MKLKENEAEKKKRVIVTDSLSEVGIKKLREFAEVDIELDLSKEDLKERIADYDAIVIRSGTKVTKEIIEAGSTGRLKVIGRAGVGVDNIAVETATEKGILVVNSPEANTISAAEHTIAMLLSLSRKIPAANVSLKSGKWDRKKHMGVEVNGKVLGIIGLGRVGSEVAKRVKGLGMKVVAYDPFITVEKAKELGITLASLNETIQVADFVTLHTPLTKDTRHLIGANEFALMKGGVRVINCARGGIIDEHALKEAIESGKVAGAALDVFEQEPPEERDLLELEEVIVTPHLGASTTEAQKAAALGIADEVIDALQNKPVRNTVNMIYVEEEIMDTIKPYLELGEKLGLLAAQLIPKTGRIEQFNVSYEGELGLADAGIGKNTRIITRAILKSSLSLFTDGVNYVNAEAIAKKFGIKITESKTEEIEDFSSLISITTITRIEGEEKKKTVAGTLFGKDDPRIVKINGYRVDASPSGCMLICSFLDKPRVIGPVCTILGDRSINIAGMQVGREKVGGEAVMVINVDSMVSEGCIEEIKHVENIFDVMLVKL
ncbi:MAG TPA: phosphoglycerate dehydrogenase [Candidatus Bathyarchaeia archaeon]|nr:phosphoglycerate dehydrogenase [Candidatus Bathyarchaeia archaeon]